MKKMNFSKQNIQKKCIFAAKCSIINQNLFIMKKLLSFVAVLFAVVAVNAQITDDFESYTAFSVDPTDGFWTFYDGDGGQTYGFSGISFENAYYTGAAIILNGNDVAEIGENYPAHSGNQFVAMFNAVPESAGGTEGVTNSNDWMISGELTNATNFSFYARELTTNYGAETMRVLYSTTTNDPSAFQLIQQESVNVAEWTEYSYNLPAGTKYVAINCTSNDVFALFIDDVTISAEGGGTGIVENNNNIAIYPNPATTILNVEADGFSTIEMVNVLGQVVYSANATSNMQINVSNLDNGVYFVRLNGANGTTTQKFIKK